MTDDLEDFYKAVIGPRGQEYYLREFTRLDSSRMAMTSWNWPAFFLAPCWFAYRKMWSSAIVYFLLPYLAMLPLWLAQKIDIGYLILFTGMLSVPPIFANALYYKRCKKVILEMRSSSSDRQEQLEKLKRKGGTSRVIAIGVLGFSIFYFIPDVLISVVVPVYQELKLRISRYDAAREEAVTYARGLKAGAIFRDCPECAEMVVIPAGSFDMGTDNAGAAERLARIRTMKKTTMKEIEEILRLTQDENAKPLHRVAIARPFALGKTEVTQGQWRRIMGNNPSKFSAGGDDCPVENVSWYEAQEFIQKLNDMTGKRYRLPSEAEWEYACVAGKRHKHCGGDDPRRVAWFGSNSGHSTHEVATRQPNAWGLYDMSGNVWEWVGDYWHENYNGAPADGSAWDGRAEFSLRRGSLWYGLEMFARRDDIRVMRGGSYQDIEGYREKNYPWIKVGGFRLARTLP